MERQKGERKIRKNKTLDDPRPSFTSTTKGNNYLQSFMTAVMMRMNHGK
jgi:hypothetical protein